MKPIFNPIFGGYYNNRAFEIAQAAKYLGTDRMVNAYDELSYGHSISGHLIINIRKRGVSKTVNAVFTDTRIELYAANSHGCTILTDTDIAYYAYTALDVWTTDGARKLIWDRINYMLINDVMTDTHCPTYATPVYNKKWNGYLNHNIEQIRECSKFITDQNLGYGQAFYGYNDMGRLIVWLNHHPSIYKFKIHDKDREKSIIVEFEGDGIVAIYNADEFGMPKDDNYRGLIDDHWSSVAGKQHSYFIEKVKKECGVHLL